MDKEEAKYQEIYAYLRGELKEEDRAAFLKKVAEDTDLAGELDFHQSVKDALDEKYIASRMQEVKLDSGMLLDFRTSTLRWAAVIIGLLFITAIIYFLIPSRPHTPLLASHEAIFEKYYDIDWDLQGSLGQVKPDLDSLEQRLYMQLSNKDHASAILSAKQLIAQYPDQVGYHYYLGLAYLGERKIDSSLLSFQFSAESKEADIRTKSLWYQSLGYVLKNDFVQALQGLDSLQNEDPDWNRSILDQLKRDLEQP